MECTRKPCYVYIYKNLICKKSNDKQNYWDKTQYSADINELSFALKSAVKHLQMIGKFNYWFLVSVGVH